jgi:drug/metabolite transporter (DMT)-like permease
VAAVLALLTALVFALSTVLQQRGTFQVPELSLRHPGSLIQLVLRPVWLASLGVMALGWVLQAAALDRGRVVIVQTFLTMTLVFALPLGAWLTAQRVTRREIVAAFAIVAGLVVFALAGNPAVGRSNAPSNEWLLATAAVTCACALILLFGDRGNASTRAAANGAVSGATAGLTAVMAKPVIIELHHGLGAVLSDPKLYIVGIYGVLGVVFQQFGLATGRLAPTVAAGSVASPVVSVVLGAALLQERLERPAWHVAAGSAALGVAMVGAIVIATAQAGTARTPLEATPTATPERS